MRVLMALPMAIVLASTPALGQDKASDDKVVCKRNGTASYTGSNLARPKKTCMKASEWKLIESEKDSSLRRAQEGRVDPNAPRAMGGGPG